MRSKLSEIYQEIACCSYDIIVFTETWLLSGIFDTEIMDGRFTIYRRDRIINIFNNKTDGGGVLIAISKKIKSYKLHSFESSCEDLWVKISLMVCGKLKDIYVCAVYLPSPIQLRLLEHFVDNANKILEDIDNCLIIGDFNMGSINWLGAEGNVLRVPQRTSSSLEQILWDFILLNNLAQYNYLCNRNNRILDLVLTNLENVSVSSPLDILSKVDAHHPPILCTLSFCHVPKPQKRISRTKLNYFKADYAAINAALNEVDWKGELESSTSIDQMVDKFYSILYELIKIYVPEIVIKDRKYPYWFSKELIKTLNEKNRLRVRVKKYKNPLDSITLESLRKRCKRMAASGYKTYITDIEAKITCNPKYFWSYLKMKRGGASNYPGSMTDGVSTSENMNEICSYFATHFSKVYQTSQSDGRTTSSCCLSNNILSLITISQDQILRALKKIDINKGAGPDNIPSLLLNKLSDSLSLPLSIIFNSSLLQGTFPSIWKETRIVPIFKSGDRSVVTNYRPIAILSVLAKVFEALICPLLYRHLSQLIIDDQYGFIKGKSTTTNLVTYAETIIDAVDARIQVDAVYTDFSKAFDTVDHGLLVDKLQLYGVSNPLLSWFKSYLSERTLKVVLNDCSSDSYIATSGIPQGSHLGPPLFILFINDIHKCFQNSKIFLFADDLKAIKHIRKPADSVQFQCDLDRLSEWCVHNKMSLNIGKCKHIKFTKKNNVVPTVYNINGQHLEEVESIRDLGVQFDRKLRFVEHVDQVILKATKILGFVMRECKSFKNIITKKIMYNSLVRSHLEYCSVVWSPKYNVHIKRIERLQKRFLWHLTYHCNMGKKLKSYQERLKYFKIVSLEKRRDMFDLIFLKKLVLGSLNCPELLSRVSFHVPRKLPRKSNRRLFCMPKCNTNLRQHCSLSRMYTVYKKYDDDIDLFHTSVPTLKRIINSDSNSN